MAKSIPISGIRDNYFRGFVADFLKSHIKEGSRLSIVSAFFTIYAYEALKDHLNRIGHMDFLFGEPRFIRSLDPDKTNAEEAGLPALEDIPEKQRLSCLQEIYERISNDRDPIRGCLESLKSLEVVRIIEGEK